MAVKSSQKPVITDYSLPLLFILLAAIICFGDYLVPWLMLVARPQLGELTVSQIAQGYAMTVSFVPLFFFLSYYRKVFHFSKKWLLATSLYSGLIIIIKFTISFSQYSPDNISGYSSMITNALLVSLLYIIGFLVIYLLFDGRLISKSLHKALITTREGKVVLATSLFVMISLVRVVLFRLPGLAQTQASDYIQTVFKTESVKLNIVIFLLILLTVEAFAAVRRRIDLKSFAIYGVGLLIATHIGWALFMVRYYRP